MNVQVEITTQHVCLDRIEAVPFIGLVAAMSLVNDSVACIAPRDRHEQKKPQFRDRKTKKRTGNSAKPKVQEIVLLRGLMEQHSSRPSLAFHALTGRLRYETVLGCSSETENICNRRVSTPQQLRHSICTFVTCS